MQQGHGNGKRRRSLGDMKTATSGRIRTKPPAQGQEYLDLWTLKRERARWSKTKEHAERIIQGIDRALKKIHLPEAAVSANEPDTPGPTKTIDFKAAAG